MRSIIVPLVKAKGGNMQHISNYRATALSNASSTILELAFKPYLENEDPCDMYHFGFAPQLSTGVCTTTFKCCIECYTQHSSHIFACFVHFSKAFNTIIYCRLFNNLLHDKVNCNIIILLPYWYCYQQTCVQCKYVYSTHLFIRNDTRQGSILSPYLFSRYNRHLIFDGN
jgi:hypothetical protein